MTISKTLTTCLLALCCWQLSAQCSSGEVKVKLEINPDYYWQEVYWTITNVNGNELASGAATSSNLQTYEYCVPDQPCLSFNMWDAAGDGIAPDGFYRIYVNDVLIFQNLTGLYEASQTTPFNCPPGTNCTSAIEITAGDHTTLDGGIQSWYAFTPAENGIYRVSTCSPDNTCGTKIWVYNTCENIEVTNNNLGTAFYSDGGCADNNNLAQADLFLAGGHTYYIRLGYKNNSTCGGVPIKFTLEYVGPVVGCTDPTACNYEPLASVSDTCIYPGDPDCGDLPDLVVVESALRNSMSLGYQNNADGCAVEEGCYKGYGPRNLIEFTTHIRNSGTEDYYIGEPPVSPSTPSTQFVWDACHFHWHYSGYAEYILFNSNGNIVPAGSKNGFCVLDLECGGNGQAKYTCENMGITAGCGDIYDKGLPCQWIDITGLPEGSYTFVVRVNWDKTPDKFGRPELTYDNNWAQACFDISYPNGILGAPFVEFKDDCPVYTDCLGEVFGSAQADCEGTCNGTALMGDWNKDSVRDVTDVVSYIDAAKTDTTLVTVCRDLFDDGHLDVYDAALLQECTLHGDEPQYWGTRFPCEFPAGLQNPKEIVYLLPGNLDTIAKTFDISMVNPFNKILGYEIEVKGLTIESVENLAEGFQAVYRVEGGRILALSTNEQPTKKNILPGNLLRIHYGELLSNKVCIDSIIAVVNNKYQLTTPLLGDPNCVTVITSGTQVPELKEQVVVVPNPALGDVTLFFENKANEPVNLKLTDLKGRVVRSFSQVRTDNLVIDRKDLPAGVYQFTLQTERGVAIGKFILL